MEYGTLIRQAWTITWRYRFLWLLGVLAGGAVGVPSLGGSGGGGGAPARGRGNVDVAQLEPRIAAAGQQVAVWAEQHIGLLVGLAALAVVLALTLLVLSLIAQGAMARATADLAAGDAADCTSGGRTEARLAALQRDLAHGVHGGHAHGLLAAGLVLAVDVA